MTISEVFSRPALSPQRWRRWRIPLAWATAGIKTKMLIPLVLLMTLSFLGSTLGFVLSTNTTRDQLLDGQNLVDARRLQIAISASEQDVAQAVQTLSADPQLLAVLQNKVLKSAELLALDRRAVAVRERYRLDQVLILDQAGQIRVNLATNSALSQLSALGEAQLPGCEIALQPTLVQIQATQLLVSCAPVFGPKGAKVGAVYTLLAVEQTINRLRREAGVVATAQLLENLPPTVALNQAPNSSFNFSTNEQRVYLTPMQLGKKLFYLQIQRSEQEIKAIVSTGLGVMLLSNTLTIILLLAVGIWLAHTFTRPILKLATVAQAVAAGDFSHRANLAQQDEIGQLGRAFDQAATTIGTLLDAQAQMAGERHAILESIADGVLAVDLEERIVLFNPAAKALLNLAESNLLGQTLNLLGEETNPALLPGMQQIVAHLRSELHAHDGQPNEGHVELGERVIRLHSTPIWAKGPKLVGVVAIMQDITQAVEADKEKREFLATAAHELRSPLAGLKCLFEVFTFNDTSNLDENQSSFLAAIKEELDFLIALVNDLLEVSRLERGMNQVIANWVTLPIVVEEALLSLCEEIKAKQVNLHLEVAPSLPALWLDRLHLRRILVNLISNAVKYTFQEGRINIRAYELHDPALLPSSPSNQDWFFQEQRSVVIEVEDDGLGINEGDQANIFRRFFRSRKTPYTKKFEGNGLGLAITRSLVELHKGQIGFRSVEGEGSCFWVRFPILNTATATFDDELANLDLGYLS